MDHLHQEFYLRPSDVIEVTLDYAANVLLLDAPNYSSYKQGNAYRYRGGYVKSPVFRISPPHEGRWHIVVDLGGQGGSVKASVRVLGVASA